MPIKSSGSFRPGQASASHSGYETGPFGTMPGGAYGMGPMWGLLQRQQQLRNKEAAARLALIEDELRNSAYGRQMAYWEASQPSEADRARSHQIKMWNAEEERKRAGGRQLAEAMVQLGGGTSAEALPWYVDQLGGAMGAEGIMAGARSAGEQWGKIGSGSAGPAAALSAARSQQMLDAGMDPFNPNPYSHIGGDTWTGPTYGSNVNLGVRGGPNPIMGVPRATTPQMPQGTIGNGPSVDRAMGSDYRYGFNFPMRNPAYEKGTVPGTVPETGKAIVHEGEVVIPSAQVDEPLLRYLQRDALRKGVPLGQAGSAAGLPAYQEGTLGEVPDEFLRWLGARGATQDALQEWGDRYGYQRQRAAGGRLLPGRGTPRVLPPAGAGNLPAPLSGPTGQGYWARGEWMADADERIRQVEQAYEEALRAASPVDRPVLEAGRQTFLQAGTTPEQAAASRGVNAWQAMPKVGLGGAREPVGAALGRIPVAERALGTEADDVVKALKKTKKGQVALAALVGAGVLGAAAMSGRPEEEDRSAADIVQQILATTLPPASIAMGKLRGQEDVFRGWGRDVGRNLQTVGGAIRDVAGPVIGGLGEQLGLGGEPQEQPATTDAPPWSGAGPSMQGPAPEPMGEPWSGTGSVEDPFKMTGERSEYEQQMDAVRGMPEQISSRHKAQMNQVQVEKMLDQLQFHGHELDDERKGMLIGLIKEKQELGKLYSKDAKEREAFVQDQMKSAQAVEQALLKIEQQEKLKGERMSTLEDQRAANRERLAMVREGARALRDQLRIAATGTPSDRARAKSYIGMLISHALKQRGYGTLSEGEELDRVEQILNLSKEDQEMAIAYLEQQLGGAR